LTIVISAHFNAIPLADSNGWFYPSHGFDTDDTGKQTERGNWGNKDKPDARWTRRGKAVSWGPGVDDMRVRASVVSAGLKTHK